MVSKATAFKTPNTEPTVRLTVAQATIRFLANQFVERDSRAFGPAVALGRVVFRLWPRPGRLPSTPL